MHTFAYGDGTYWEKAGSIATVIITIFGVLHLKNQNQGSFGNGFLNKYFALGWVITIRLLLIAIPVAVILFALAVIVGGGEAVAPAGAIFTIAFEVLFYWWLGIVIGESQESDR